MKDREQRIVNGITQKIGDYRAKEFFVKADPEINIREIAQALVNYGYSIEEYSFGEQTGKDGVRLGEWHRLLVRKDANVNTPRDPGPIEDIDESLRELFGLKKK